MLGFERFWSIKSYNSRKIGADGSLFSSEVYQQLNSFRLLTKENLTYDESVKAIINSIFDQLIKCQFDLNDSNARQLIDSLKNEETNKLSIDYQILDVVESV